MLKLPITDIFEKAGRVLIVGAGGGFDVFAGLPLYFGLNEAGKEVFLANYSYSHLLNSGALQIIEGLFAVNDSVIGDGYFPEKYLCDWFWSSQKTKSTIYAFQYGGVMKTQLAIEYLIDFLKIDTLFLVDGGTDILLRGDEPDLGTPLEDMTTLMAVAQISVKQKIICCLGFGVDSFHGVCHAYVLETIANVTQQGGFYGSFSLNQSMPECLLYKEACDYVFSQKPNKPSIVNNSILASIDGHFGNYHRTKSTKNNKYWINPLMSQYWFLDLDLTARRVLYGEKLKQTETHEDVIRVIQTFRKNLGYRRPFVEMPI